MRSRLPPKLVAAGSRHDALHCFRCASRETLLRPRLATPDSHSAGSAANRRRGTCVRTQAWIRPGVAGRPSSQLTVSSCRTRTAYHQRCFVRPRPWQRRPDLPYALDDLLMRCERYSENVSCRQLLSGSLDRTGSLAARSPRPADRVAGAERVAVVDRTPSPYPERSRSPANQVGSS